ncbi:MAG: hypothetical protein NC102_02985 [Clostridium sp.]|nr:hypothetical protein [Clostridium sp.]
MGHEVTVASAGNGWMQTYRDIDLSRKSSLWGGFKLCCRMHRLCANELKGFDIVQLHDPIFVELRPYLLRPLFDKIKKQNGRVFLTSLSNDTPYVRMCIGNYGPLRYNEYRVDGKPTPFALRFPEIEYNWTHSPLKDYTDYLHDNLDGCITALYEYHVAMRRCFPKEKIAYAGIPIEIPTETPCCEIGEGPVRILAACHKGREIEKGFDILLDAVRNVISKHPGKISLDIVQNVPFPEFLKRLDNAHIVIDQLYSYSPATTALMAMARGKAVVSGGEKAFYDFIGEDFLRPIINPDPADIPKFERMFNTIIEDTSLLEYFMSQGRSFIDRNNSAELVARRMLSFWESIH